MPQGLATMVRITSLRPWSYIYAYVIKVFLDFSQKYRWPP